MTTFIENDIIHIVKITRNDHINYDMNRIDKEIDTLNGILNRMNIKGFHFVDNFNRISLCIPRKRTSMCTTSDDYIIGIWDSLPQLFSGHHIVPIRFLIKCINKANKRGTNELYVTNNPVDYLGINNNGQRFLKLLCSCSSHK